MFVYCSIVCLSMFVLPGQITKVEKIVFGYAESQHNMTCNLRGGWMQNVTLDVHIWKMNDGHIQFYFYHKDIFTRWNVDRFCRLDILIGFKAWFFCLVILSCT